MRFLKYVGAKFVATAAICGLSASPAFADHVYVTNEKDDTVSVIDVKTLEVIKTIPVGERPRGIILSKDKKHVYICASDSDTVQVMELATGKILHELPSGQDPEQFVLHPTKDLLFIANEDDAITTVVDVKKRTVVAQIDVGIEPEGMAVSPDGKWAITTSETTNFVHWINTETFVLEHNSLVDQRPRHAEFTHDGKQLWVSAEIGGTVTVFNVEDQSEVAKISFEIAGMSKDRIQPVGIRFAKDGSKAFVALGPSNRVAVIDTKTFKVIKYMLVGRRVWHIGITDDGKLGFSTNGISGDVSVLDLESLKVLKTIKVGRYPWGAAVVPSP